MAQPKREPDLEALVTDFQQNYGRGKQRPCIVCSSPHHDLIDILARGGAGGPSISRFLRDRLNERISEAAIGRHKAEHLNVDQKR